MMSRRHSCSHCIESGCDLVDPSCEERSVRQHDIDFVSTVCETSTDQCNDLASLITSSREVDDCRNRNPGSFESTNGTRHESRPDAHGSHIPVRTMCPSTQKIDIGLGARVVEIREIDESENSLCESSLRR